jgi:hypothetical protein
VQVCTSSYDLHQPLSICYKCCTKALTCESSYRITGLGLWGDDTAQINRICSGPSHNPDPIYRGVSMEGVA